MKINENNNIDKMEIEKSFETFLHHTYSELLPDMQYKQLKRAFYFGASEVLLKVSTYLNDKNKKKLITMLYNTGIDINKFFKMDEN